MADDGREAAARALAKQAVQLRLRNQASQMKLGQAKRKLSQSASAADTGNAVVRSKDVLGDPTKSYIPASRKTRY